MIWRICDRCIKSPGYLLLTLMWFYSSVDAAGGAEPPVPDRLEYQVSYQGILTADSKISIARVSLQTRKISLPSFEGPLFETSMRVSSDTFAFVEEHFPIRVRYRSLYQVAPFALLVLEKYKLTDKLKHEVTWVDKKTGSVGRYRQQASGPALPGALGNWLATENSFKYHKPARHKILDGLVDRLAMLQSLRLRQLASGAEYRFHVTDGKRLLDYRVEVVGLEQIEHAGKHRQAWQLILNGFSTKKGVTTPRHAPIYLWLSEDRPRLPLRFSHQHPMGDFTVELQ